MRRLDYYYFFLVVVSHLYGRLQGLDEMRFMRKLLNDCFKVVSCDKLRDAAV